MPLAVVGVLSAATTVGTLHYFDSNHDTNGDFNYFHTSRKDGQFASLNAVALGDDFVKASKTAVPAVVTIKTTRAMPEETVEWIRICSTSSLETHLEEENSNLSSSNRQRICLRVLVRELLFLRMATSLPTTTW